MIRQLDLFFGTAFLFMLSLFKFKNKKPNYVHKIAVLKIRGFGDTILISTSISKLRLLYPNAKIFFIGDKSTFPLSSFFKDVDQNIYFSLGNFFSCLLQIRKENFDLFFDFGAWSRIEALIAFLSNSKFTIGFSTTGQFRHFLFDGIVHHDSRIHEFNNYLNLSNFGCSTLSSEKFPLLTLLPSVKSFKLPFNNYVAIHPWAGGSAGKYREWPNHFWSHLFEFLVSKGFSLVLVTGPSDLAKSMDMVKRNVNIVKSFYITSALSLDETISVIQGANFGICINSGIMHLCAAVNLPTIGLSGPTNVLRWGPLGPNSYSVTPTSGDFGYLNHGFEYLGHNKNCMHNIHPNSVIEIIEKNGLLNEKS